VVVRVRFIREDQPDKLENYHIHRVHALPPDPKVARSPNRTLDLLPIPTIPMAEDGDIDVIAAEIVTDDTDTAIMAETTTE